MMMAYSAQQTERYWPGTGTGPGPGPGPPAPPPDVRVAMYHFQGNETFNNTRDAPRRPPGRFNFRHKPPRTAERALLTSRRPSSPDLTFGRDDGPDKFRHLDHLTDTDETDMELSESDHDDKPQKKLRIGDDPDQMSAVPRWSNPDPYTALPPPDESSRKRKDVVRLIRKARILDTSRERETDAATNDDFISLDFKNDDDLDMLLRANNPPPNAPIGPKIQAVQTGNEVLGKRRRMEPENDGNFKRIKGRRGGFMTNGVTLQKWRPTELGDRTPWFQAPADNICELPGIALHKEIIDFYEWVRPRDFEAAIRADVINRLQNVFERIEPGCQIKPFGSFAAGLYLPIGDMDLVLIERRYLTGWTPLVPPTRRVLERFRNFIANQKLAKHDSVIIIPSAKVPIIKFVERISGLKVDLSFNNDTGLVANQTVQSWKSQYTAMPILVAVIKQFLMIRGLNDVSTGGLGGFAIICLVTSLAQHLPSSSSPPNLGVMLMEFFNLYGKIFNRYEIGIRLEPPGYVEKRRYGPLAYSREGPERLTIIDPNRPDNNISGGTKQIGLIFECFSRAHDHLNDLMTGQLDGFDIGTSLLEDVIGGNFTAYELQRAVLSDLHSRVFAQAAAVAPPVSAYGSHQSRAAPLQQQKVLGAPVSKNLIARSHPPKAKSQSSVKDSGPVPEARLGPSEIKAINTANHSFNARQTAASQSANLVVHGSEIRASHTQASQIRLLT